MKRVMLSVLTQPFAQQDSEGVSSLHGPPKPFRPGVIRKIVGRMKVLFQALTGRVARNSKLQSDDYLESIHKHCSQRQKESPVLIPASNHAGPVDHAHACSMWIPWSRT